MKFLWNNARRNVRQDLAWTAGYPNTIAYPFIIRTGASGSTNFSTNPAWNIDQSTNTYTLNSAPTENTINGLDYINCSGTNEEITIPPLADSGIRVATISINSDTISFSAPTLKKVNFSSVNVDMYALSSINFSALQEGNIALINTNFSSVVSFPSYVGAGYSIIDIDSNDVNVDFPNLQLLDYLKVNAISAYLGNFSKLTTVAKLDFYTAGSTANFPLLESVTDGDHESTVEANAVYGKFTNCNSAIHFQLISHIEIFMFSGSMIVEFNSGVGSPFSLFANGANIGDVHISSLDGGNPTDWDTLFAHANQTIEIGSGNFTAPAPTGGYTNPNLIGLTNKGFTVSLI